MCVLSVEVKSAFSSVVVFIQTPNSNGECQCAVANISLSLADTVCRIIHRVVKYTTRTSLPLPSNWETLKNARPDDVEPNLALANIDTKQLI